MRALLIVLALIATAIGYVVLAILTAALGALFVLTVGLVFPEPIYALGNLLGVSTQWETGSMLGIVAAFFRTKFEIEKRN